eukprot:scaffold10334_cov71-Phaeocystis_antarctica.AAC.5
MVEVATMQKTEAPGCWRGTAVGRQRGFQAGGRQAGSCPGGAATERSGAGAPIAIAETVSHDDMHEESMTRDQAIVASTIPSTRPSLASTRITLRALLVFTWPVARPRMMFTVDWLPALPPAPTSIVRKRVTTTCFFSISSKRDRIMPLADCMTMRPASTPMRSLRTFTGMPSHSGSSASGRFGLLYLSSSGVAMLPDSEPLLRGDPPSRMIRLWRDAATSLSRGRVIRKADTVHQVISVPTSVSAGLPSWPYKV